MKTLVYLLLVLCLAITSCKKHWGDVPLPSPTPLNFEIKGKNGKSMVNSLQDTVTITYNNYSNLNKTSRLTVRNLYTNFTDTTTISPKYNGLYITDNGQMSSLSSQSPAVNTFNLSVNGVNAGVVFINYRQYIASYPLLSSVAFTFNNLPAGYDATIVIPGSGLSLLQVQ